MDYNTHSGVFPTHLKYSLLLSLHFGNGVGPAIDFEMIV
jgi:hypothetical protein